MRNDDARWVAAALAGRADGYRALFERHRGEVERLAQAFPDLQAHDAAAAVEECFAEAFAHLHELKEPSRFGAWLLARMRSRCLALAGPQARSHPAAPARYEPDLAADPGPDELKRRLAKAALESFAASPEEEVGALFFRQRLPAGEVAARLGVEPGQVLARIERIRARVKARLLARLLEGRVPAPEDAGPPCPRHVDAAGLARLLGTERAAGEAALAAHLAEGCAACEASLAHAHEVDALDGEVDRALLAPVATRTRYLDEDFARVMRRLKLGSRLQGRSEQPVRPAGPSKVLPLSLAALLGGAAAVALLLQRVPAVEAVSRRGEPQVALSFALVPPDGAGEPEPGRPGASYSDDRELRLHFRTSSPGFVTVLRAGDAAGWEVLERPGRLGAGDHELRVSGQPARVALAGARGWVRFAVAHSAAPLAEAQLERLGRALAAGELEAAWADGTVVAGFEIEVVAR